MSNQQQTMGFQAEVKQMLHLVVHSLYSNKEIFLRELISNASDALDKLRFLALSKADLYENDSDLQITISIDEKKKTLTISDNGVGLSREEAIDNLGTIAKSGTKEFLSHLSNDSAKNSQLIGQFGVGFYSAFIVADKVTVESRRAGLPVEDGIVWKSTGEGEFTIATKKRKARGTSITLHFKDDAEEFLTDWRCRSIIHKYSDHICWPILMKKVETATEEDKKEAKSPEYETVNKATALWTLQKSDIKDDDYKTLYKHISHDDEDPLVWSHNHVEGKQDYISLLFIPARAPYDLWQPEFKHGLKLYIKRVFIMDEATQFLPRYLRFVKGIIDASDLPLNVSRELLQDNKQVESIRSACTKRVISLLEKMSKSDPEKYQTFWDTFGVVIKEGPIEDFANRENIAKLLRFATTKSDGSKQTVSLAEYVERMQKDQDKIYYVTAPSHNAAKNSPHLEIFKKKDIEVLLLSDKVDEWLVSYLGDFEEKKLQSISKGKVDIQDEEEKKDSKKEEELFAPMIEQIKTILEGRAKDAHLTHRLTDSPACVVADEHDMGLEMQRIMQASGQDMPASLPIFEINPMHPLIKHIHGVQDEDVFKQWINMLFDQAILAEGGQLDSPADFVARINKLLVSEVQGG